jgi:hypothetical protein
MRIRRIESVCDLCNRKVYRKQIWDEELHCWLKTIALCGECRRYVYGDKKEVKK